MTDSSLPSRREIIGAAALAALPLPGCASVQAKTAASLTGSLRARAETKGLLIGAAFDWPAIAKDPRLRAEAARDYNCLTPENGFNWSRLQPSVDAPLDFRQAEPLIALARTSTALVRLHNLHYDKTLPAWVKEAVRTGTPAQVEALLDSHVRAVLARWGTLTGHINVVNEPEYGVGKPFRSDVFADRIGERYIDIAFHAAREAAPDALLFINIAGVEGVGRRYDGARFGALELIDRMLARGVPLQAVGIEGHLNSEDQFDDVIYSDFLSKISSRGLRIMISEFDVIDTAYPADPVRRDAQVAALTEAFLVASFDDPNCLGASTWSPVDRYSWLVTEPHIARPDGVPRRPGLLNVDFLRKPVWGAVARALDQAKSRDSRLTVPRVP